VDSKKLQVSKVALICSFIFCRCLDFELDLAFLIVIFSFE